jgi:adenosine kinase
MNAARHPSMHTLICGSMAYDTIMVFKDRFKHHILPDQIHILNVSFLVPDMRREFGGCAGNIAYNLMLLGGSPLIMATVGQDYAPYAERLQQLGLRQTHVRQVPETYTAQAFITTDLDDNQITAFHPGAMSFSHLNSVRDAQDVALGIVAPDGRDGMLQHARDLAEAGVPFVFDPGQGLPMFSGEELLAFIRQATYVTVNDYEGRLLQERTGLTLEQLARQVEALIVTQGAEGSVVFTGTDRLQIPAVQPERITDPTGCGDAYRGGLLYGLALGLDWRVTGRLASLLGSIKIASRGGQNHRFTRDEIADRFQAAFRMRPW